MGCRECREWADNGGTNFGFFLRPSIWERSGLPSSGDLRLNLVFEMIDGAVVSWDVVAEG